MTRPTTDQQLDEYSAIASRAADDPFYVSDCEGSLQVWREKALTHVRRDESGEIDMYSFPSTYKVTDQIIELDLDTWDPGEDATDDQQRQDITDLVEARAALPVLLDMIRRQRAELEARTEDLASADNPTHLRWGLNDVLWSDDDSVLVMLSGPDLEAYWLELDPERAAVLREDLAGPDGAPSPERDALIAELLPAWEAMYEPGNVSDYLIGYMNDQDAATGAAEAWMRSQSEVTGRLEWVPWGDVTPMPDGYDRWFELAQRHDDGIDTGPGIVVRRRTATAVETHIVADDSSDPTPAR